MPPRGWQRRAPGSGGGIPDSRIAERWLVRLIAIHSLAVGLLLMAFPRWAADFGGWGSLGEPFFVRQAGVFHVVVAVGYLLEYRRHRGVGLLLLAKSVAVVFLLAATVAGAPWAVPLSAAGDAAMALAVAVVHRRTQRAGGGRRRAGRSRRGSTATSDPPEGMAR